MKDSIEVSESMDIDFVAHVLPYLYRALFVGVPEIDDSLPPFVGGCSSYVLNGKLYRHLDWDYSEIAEFYVKCPTFEGMAFIPDLCEGSIDLDKVRQLPYHIVDGVNDDGIIVSTHVLYNDWEWEGTGDISLTQLPYLVLSKVKSMATISEDLAEVYPIST